MSVPVIGVIEPGAEAARRASKTGDVLVIATDATVTMDKVDPAGWTVTAIHLDVKCKIPGADKAKFEEAAEHAKDELTGD